MLNEIQENEIIKAPCNECGIKTNHKVIKVRETSGFIDGNNPPDEPPEWTERHTLLECCGCESVCLRYEGDFDYIDELQIIYYPPRISRRLSKWINNLPDDI